MRRRTSTTIAATTALALMVSLASADRAEARRWGWGIGAGIATVDQVVGVAEHRQQFTTVEVIEKSADFLAGQRSGKPLHVVFYKHLHRGAVDRSRALDSHAHPSADGHVRA